MRVDSIETGTDELLAHRADGVTTLTLNRPKARNSLSDTLSPALRQTLAHLAGDPDTRCLVITGTGDAFCSGGDIKGMGSSGQRPAAARTRDEVVSDLTQRQLTLTGALYALPQPTIASLPGPAVGAGLSIALACDLRIMADSAFVATGFRNVGLSGDYGASFFLTQIVGSAKARELFFTNARINADTCLALGIANRVVPRDRLESECTDLARDLAAGPPRAFQLMKENLDRALREDLPTCLAGEAAGVVASAGTADHKEAVRAFIEKRPPKFTGS